jgi:UrcA family protein
MDSISPWQRIACVAAMLASAWPLAALADPAEGRDSVVQAIRVPYGDLDLNTPQGIATLYVRIHKAASELCDARRPAIGTRLISTVAKSCVRSSVAATVKQLRVPGLATLHAEQQALQGAAAATSLCEPSPRARIII